MKTLKSIIAEVPTDKDLCTIYPNVCGFIQNNEVNLTKVHNIVENYILNEGIEDIYEALSLVEINLQTPETDE